MTQFRGARVRVQNGSATVRQVYSPTIGVKVGTFTAAEAVSWAGGGAGVYVSDDGVTIKFYRTSGPNPAVGNTITGGTSLATATLASFPSENLSLTAPVAAQPALFSTSTTQGVIATNDEFVITGQPVAKVSATIGSDSFDLTAAWAGSTLTDVECVIVRDRTANFGWPIVEPASRLPFDILKEMARQIDEDVNGIGAGAPPTDFTSITLTSPWQNVPTIGQTAAHCRYPAADATQLKGLIDNNATAVATGATIAAAGQIPSGSRPLQNLYVFAGEWIAIRTDGSITFEGNNIPTGVTIRLSLQHVFRADGS